MPTHETGSQSTEFKPTVNESGWVSEDTHIMMTHPEVDWNEIKDNPYMMEKNLDRFRPKNVWSEEKADIVFSKEDLKKTKKNSAYKNKFYFKELATDVNVEENTKEAPHYFARTKAWDGKKSKEEKIGEDPFAVLASCKRFKSSKEMNRIKDSLEEIEKIMMEKVSDNETEFNLGQQKCLEAYNKVIENCDKYLDSRKSPITSNGKRRRLMIENIRRICSDEMDRVEVVSINAFNNLDENEPPRWIDILSEARTVNISKDLDVKKTKTISERPIMEVYENDGEQMLFKAGEKIENNSMVDRLQYNLREDRHRFINDILKNDPNNPETMETLERFISSTYESKPILVFSEDTVRYLSAAAEEHSFNELLYATGEEFNIKNVIDEMLGDKYDALRYCIWDREQDPYTIRKFLNLIREIHQAAEQRDHCDNVGIKAGATLTYHNIAASRVAKLLGVSELVAESVKVKNERGYYGSFTEISKDAKLSDIMLDAKKHNKEIRYSEEAQMQSCVLKFLDCLCGKKQGNYNCTVNKNNEPWEITQITVADNEFSFGELQLFDQIEDLREQYDDVNTVLGHAAGNYLMSLTSEQLRYTLMDLLPKGALDAAVIRLEHLQNVLSMSPFDNIM